MNKEDFFKRLLLLKWVPKIDEDKSIFFYIEYNNYSFKLYYDYIEMTNLYDDTSKEIIINNEIYDEIYEIYMPLMLEKDFEDLQSVFDIPEKDIQN